MDESEWDDLVKSMEPVLVAMTTQPPWGVELETNHNKALAVTDVKKGSAAETAGLEPGMVLTCEYMPQSPHSLISRDVSERLLVLFSCQWHSCQRRRNRQATGHELRHSRHAGFR